MKNIIYIFSMLFVLTGCGKQIEDFVKSGAKKTDSTVSKGNSNPYAIKVSPGAVVTTGTAAYGRAVVTKTEKSVSGSQVSGRVSFHQNRPSL